MKAFDDAIGEIAQRYLAMTEELARMRDQVALFKAAKHAIVTHNGVIRGFSSDRLAQISDLLANCNIKHVRTVDSVEVIDESI